MSLKVNNILSWIPSPENARATGPRSPVGWYSQQSSGGQNSRFSEAEYLWNSCIPFCSFADCQKQTPRVFFDWGESTPGFIDKSMKSTSSVRCTSLHSFSHRLQPMWERVKRSTPNTAGTLHAFIYKTRSWLSPVKKDSWGLFLAVCKTAKWNAWIP